MWRRLAWPLQVAIRSTKDAKWTFGSRLVKKCAPMKSMSITHLDSSQIWKYDIWVMTSPAQDCKRRTLEVNESIHQPRQEKNIQVAVPNIDCQCMHHFESWDCLAYRFFWRPGSRWPPHKNISAWVMNHKYKPNINYININYIITRMIRP